MRPFYAYDSTWILIEIAAWIVVLLFLAPFCFIVAWGFFCQFIGKSPTQAWAPDRAGIAIPQAGAMKAARAKALAEWHELMADPARSRARYGDQFDAEVDRVLADLKDPSRVFARSRARGGIDW